MFRDLGLGVTVAIGRRGQPSEVMMTSLILYDDNDATGDDDDDENGYTAAAAGYCWFLENLSQKPFTSRYSSRFN